MVKNNWIENLIKKQEEDREITKKLLSDTSYIEWISSFTQDKDGFDDETLFSLDKDDPNKKYIKYLNLFYDGINEYAERNYIYPELNETTHHFFGSHFNIRLNDFGFEIGYISGQGVIFLCNKKEIENESDFIDFNDIITNKKQDNVDSINETLNNLSTIVSEAYQNGVPIEAIRNRIDLTIRDLNKIEKDKHKKLIREPKN